MKDSILKFTSSIVLVLLVITAIICILTDIVSVNILNTIEIAIMATCLAKFLIVTILEPDTIWEIIKKFIYILIFIIVLLGIALQNKYCIYIGSFIAVIDTIFEVKRFIKHLLDNM